MAKKTLIVFLFPLLLISAMSPAFAYWPIRLAVAPPATSSWDLTNGTPRDIILSVPEDFDWKEDKQENIGYGTFSNRIFVKGNNDQRYRLSISISGPLTNGVNTLPYTDLQYLLTYNNGSGEVLAPGSYTSFSISPADIYYSITQEGSPSNVTGGPEREFQFLYAIKNVPKGTPPGIYTATITYNMLEDDAVSISKTCDIRVTVGSSFRMTIDRENIDFEKMTPGQTKDDVPAEGVEILTYTNTGNPWFLKISNDSPLSSGPFIIPNSDFIWYGWTDGSGTWYGTGTDQMTLVPTLMYASGAAEGSTFPDGLINHLKFKLTVPKGQPGGKYLSTVRLTLTE